LRGEEAAASYRGDGAAEEHLFAARTLLGGLPYRALLSAAQHGSLLRSRYRCQCWMYAVGGDAGARVRQLRQRGSRTADLPSERPNLRATVACL